MLLKLFPIWLLCFFFLFICFLCSLCAPLKWKYSVLLKYNHFINIWMCWLTLFLEENLSSLSVLQISSSFFKIYLKCHFLCVVYFISPNVIFANSCHCKHLAPLLTLIRLWLYYYHEVHSKFWIKWKYFSWILKKKNLSSLQFSHLKIETIFKRTVLLLLNPPISIMFSQFPNA